MYEYKRSTDPNQTLTCEEVLAWEIHRGENDLELRKDNIYKHLHHGASILPKHIVQSGPDVANFNIMLCSLTQNLSKSSNIQRLIHHWGMMSSNVPSLAITAVTLWNITRSRTWIWWT